MLFCMAGETDRPWTAILWPLAGAAVFGAAYVMVNSWPKVPPATGEQWLPVVLVPAGVVIAVVGAFRRVPRWFVPLTWTLLAAAVPALLLHPLIPHAMAMRDAILTMVGLGLIGGALMAIVGPLERNAPAWSAPASLAVVAAATGAAVLRYHYATIALPTIALGGAMFLGALVLAVAHRRGRAEGCGAMALLVLLCVWVLWMHYLDPGPSPLEAALIAAAWPASWVANLVARKVNPWVLGVIRVVITAIPSAVVVLLSGGGASESGYGY
ncbi:MAG: hypothetical protein CMJ18_04775 [Phycisphaeraceae bacterium]|nr:hypothetical protein [Phycisphaeraceae bacterium]